jgi:hypothetical protein
VERTHVAFLELKTGSRSGERIALGTGRVVIGRHPACDIVIDASAVSRQHAAITTLGAESVIDDLRSRNGTTVNGRAVTGPQRLEEGFVPAAQSLEAGSGDLDEAARRLEQRARPELRAEPIDLRRAVQCPMRVGRQRAGRLPPPHPDPARARFNRQLAAKRCMMST